MSHRAGEVVNGSAAFTLVLAGGGARGFSHVGALRALEEEGCRPGALVGVSMGALVAATYAARDDWYEALLGIDTDGFPRPVPPGADDEGLPRLRRALGYAQTAWNMITGWGAPPSALDAGRQVIEDLLGSATLEDGRVPLAVCATDLGSGRRVVLRSGLAADGVYASAALAGVLPPLARDGWLLADGAYSDIAPVDVARDFGNAAVLVVDPSQPSETVRPGNGLQALMRAMEICHLRHAELRMREADLVFRPDFRRYVDVLDFDARLECVEAGRRAVVAQRAALRRLLGAPGRPYARDDAGAVDAEPGRGPVSPHG